VKRRIENKKESKNNTNDNDYYIAVDIGKRKCVVCVTDKDGSIVEETNYSNTLQEVERFASDLNKKYDNRKCHAVCESTANMWLKTYQAFENHGIDIKLANPMKTKAIAEAKIKTDKLDARTLAHLLRSDLIAESYIAPEKVREDRSLLRLRINLVSDRTRVMNRVHSLLDKYDLKCKYDHIFGVNGIRWLKSIALVSWCGLCPTVHQSGTSMYMGRMKKDGNKKINWIMIQAANTASRTDIRLKRYYTRIAKKHGHHVAITHVANKMIRIIWAMLTYKQLYNERKMEQYERKLKRIQE
jgi:transposase